MDMNRRRLMTERDAALAAKDFARYNELTRQIADLPLKGVPKLTKPDVDRYVQGKRRAS